ncbi:uncharacterized protein N7477_002932 [Penicillium maclennaniae]|uniref:uncharacterized protein n=1 Tax=Penicillium maclennaniae TaxID=1343394 RepID=UPI002540711C|nr:uncharacterized protein N7477_002932 [Penicillium maclennaniae]KAJ5677299.1 hypothetical protein N7477_002932 [Penicillium maclennaniae]
MIKVNPNFQSSQDEPRFILRTRDYPLRRGFYAVYVFQYADGSKCAVQLPIFMPSSTEEEREAITTTVERETFTLEYLEDRGFPWSPRPITYSVRFDNPVKFPYMLLSWFDGKPMQWEDEIPASLDVREKVSKQLAHIMVDLALATEQHRNPNLPSLAAFG